MFCRKTIQLPDAFPRHLQLRRTNMLKPLLLLPAVVLFAIGAASNPLAAPQEGASSKTSKAAANELVARGKKIYQVDCALCHGDNGNGKTDLAKDMQLTLSDLTDPKTLDGKTDDQLFDLIRKGKDKMPGEEAARAKNEEVKALVQYIRTFSKNQPASTPAAAPAEAPAATPPPASSAPTAPGSN
jgi:mono/diheme cytochrome c family protein